MRLLAPMLGTTILAACRLWSRRWLTLCLLLGLTAAVALLTAVPMYAEAAQHRLLQGQLIESGTRLPPFAFLWRFVGSWNEPLDGATYERADVYFSQQVGRTLDLPLEQEVRHVQTEKMQLFPAPESQLFVDNRPLMWASVGFLSGLEAQVQIVEGVFPGAEGGPLVPVLASRRLAEQSGLQVGEEYLLFSGEQGAGDIRLQISGIWQPRDREAPYWFYAPDAFDDVFLTTPQAFHGSIAPTLEAPVAQAIWYQVYDGSRVRSDEVERLLQGVRAVEARATALLPGVGLAASPVPAMQLYRRDVTLLTGRLVLFSIPVVGLVAYFILLIAGLVVQQDQNEIAVLRSRGSSRAQMLFIYVVEGLLVGVVGLALGLLLGSQVAGLMGQTRSFLVLDDTLSPLTVVLSPTVWRYGLGAVLLVILALLLPAWQAAGQTIISYKWQRGRSWEPPFWQRAHLDFLLLVPLLYGLFLLRQQGGVTVLAGDGDPVANPLLQLLPALFCATVLLFFMRLFPHTVAACARLVERLSAVTPLLLLRQVARAPGAYSGALLLVSLTLSLALFNASLARTLDEHLEAQVYYETGADLQLFEGGESTVLPESSPAAADQSFAEQASGPRFLFLPVEEQLNVDGVQAVARVGDYGAMSNLGGRQATGRLLGIDRLPFPRVASFRPDFAAGEPLGALMNRLAQSADHLLINRDFLTRNNLAIGDRLDLTISTAGELATLSFTVAGAFDLFPTYEPAVGPLFVANLDYVHSGLGGVYPYEVWLATDPTVSTSELVAGLRALGFEAGSAQDARALLQEAYARPGRQGVLGLLSAGFVGAAVLSLLGFFVYTVAGFRRRFVELGLLRAIGLSLPQMAGLLVGEQLLLIASGLGSGALTGVAASRLFIPFLQLERRLLPFSVRLSWAELAAVYPVYSALLLLTIVALLAQLWRMRLFEAIKLGEAV